ncbi:hypothetical protein [Microvirga sp. M2]|uniref:hypothetical protein n=1 Tax=Microvirga sp. M2 TaxID=3073270 RepID=UPI0039C173DB
MTDMALPSPRGRSAMTALAIGLSGLAIVAIGWAFAPAAMAQGWLLAFLFWSSIPVGSLVLLLIHRLVGGRWGDAFAPALLAGAGLVPLAALAFLPIVLGLTSIYPWAAQPASVPPDVGHIYLNAWSFLVRALVGLGGWTVLSILVIRGRCTMLAAGLGLAFHGLAVSLLAVDWILSVDPTFTSTAFAACIAIQQILAALAWAALSSPAVPDKSAADIGGLLIAALLGVVYLGLMSYIVIWYGNLPEKAAWYLMRNSSGWSWVIAMAVLIGAVVPLGMLLRRSIRQNHQALRLVGGLILIGIWLHLAWLLAPSFDPGWLPATALGLVTMGGISLGVMTRITIRSGRSADHAE